MNRWTEKVIVGTLGAALLVGGIAGLGTQKVFADDDSYMVIPPAPVDTSIALNQRFPLKTDLIVTISSAYLDMEYGDLSALLTAGESLTGVAASKQMNVNEVMNPVIHYYNYQIDIALDQNIITSAEASQLKAKAAQQVKKAFGTVGYQDSKAQEITDARSAWTIHHEESITDLAQLLNISPDELTQEMNNEKSLAEISKEKGISKNQLIAKLKDELTLTLEQFIDQN